MISEDVDLINRFLNERNVKLRTRYGYKDALNKYSNFVDDSLLHRLNLYEKEEEEIVWKKRTMKKDLIGFQNWLLDNLLFTTAKAHFTRVLTFLRHYDFEIHTLPKMNRRNAKNSLPIYHNDLLKKEELEKVLQVCDYDVVKCLILFCCTSGCGRAESLSLTVKDYLQANNVLFKDNLNLKTLIRSVDSSQIPTFHLKRIKTNKYYYTFCTPQVNHMIKEYLLTRKRLNLNSPLFKTNLDYLNTILRNLNEELGLGKAGCYKRLRMHMFRKYNASTLYNNGMSIQDVDCLQGRGKDSTHQSYFMEDPNKLKEKYLKYVDVLTI